MTARQWKTTQSRLTTDKIATLVHPSFGECSSIQPPIAPAVAPPQHGRIGRIELDHCCSPSPPNRNKAQSKASTVREAARVGFRRGLYGAVKS